MAVVDSGATACTVRSDDGVTEMETSRSVFTGFDSKGSVLTGDVDGNLHLYVTGESGRSKGSSVTIPVTVLKQGRHNLFSVSVIVEQLGWKLIIQPSYKGVSGFYKTVDGVECCLPVVYDASSRLYNPSFARLAVRPASCAAFFELVWMDAYPTLAVLPIDLPHVHT